MDKVASVLQHTTETPFGHAVLVFGIATVVLFIYKVKCKVMKWQTKLIRTGTHSH